MATIDKNEQIRTYRLEIDDKEYNYVVYVDMDVSSDEVRVRRSYNDENPLMFGEPETLEAFAAEVTKLAAEMKKWPQFRAGSRSK